MDGAASTASFQSASSSDDVRRYVIKGSRRLEGTVVVNGAKNAISKQLVATLLTSEPCVFRNVPRIAEIDAVLHMLSDIGTEHLWLGPNELRVCTPEIKSPEVGQEYSGFNRIPILMLSPLLHRIGSATVPTVGGCDIGPRPVDFHLRALEAMGARIENFQGGYSATSEQLLGAEIVLPFPSVGATETSVFAAVLAKGTTVISNAAIEPEIIDTILFLQKMGAQITVDVNRRIVIEGVDLLNGAEHSPITDRIEVASFAAAAVATDGCVSVKNARQEHMTSFLNQLRKVGGGFIVEADGIRFFRESTGLAPVHIETDVHPGFMTDWQQPLTVLLTQANGMSVIHETVYENRFGYTEALSAMGARVELSEFCMGRKPCRFPGKGHLHSCVVHGATPLSGCPIRIPDLRAGFAYLIAALIAKGTTELSGIEYLERGYADVPAKLASIKAEIDVIGPTASLPYAA